MYSVWVIAKKLCFYTSGRSDCIPSSIATSKQGYLASKIEITPDQNGNGPKTTQYFKDNFNLQPKEALALMGAHTIGKYSGFQTHIDYAWVKCKIITIYHFEILLKTNHLDTLR